jgi:tetratricopeptide (TPR) repeat protein
MNPDCSTAVLEQFLQGDLPETAVARLHEHLASCVACQQWLDARADKPTLRAWVARLKLVQRDVLHEPALRCLLDGLRGGPPTPLRETRIEPPRAALPFLEPPSAAGELGRLGPYRIVAELGRGGMGIVFRAIDEDLRRTVALKVLRPDLADPEKAQARLLREAQLAARFRHEHVVGVHAVAQAPGGLPYLVMEYVDGQPLSALLLAQKRLEPRQAVEWIVQAADGLAAAHAAGLVHRDIKPGNILIEKATGKAKLGDFGLARAEVHTQALTQEGVMLGTPVYMSPEQARAATTDPRTDVYSMGVTLYEVLTGEVPFHGTGLMVVRQILTEEPRPPRRLNDQIPRDLEVICLKAMAKEPARRYDNAGEMADDLRRWQRGEPIRARPAGPVYRGWRWCRRRPLVAGLAAALLLTFLAGFAGVFAQWRQAEAARDEEARQRGEAEAARDAETRQHAAAEGARAAEVRQRERAETSYHLARQALDRIMKLKNDPRLQEGDLQDLQTELAQAEKAFYEQFVQVRGDDPAFKFERARALWLLGDLTTQLGTQEEAVRHYRHALELFDSLARQHPDAGQYRDGSAAVLAGLAQSLHALGRLPEAEGCLHKAVELNTEAMAREPFQPGLLEGKASALILLSRLYVETNRWAKAEDVLRQALDLQTRLVEQAPGAHPYLDKKATSLADLANACNGRGRPREAEAYSNAALAVRRNLVRLHPDLPPYQRALAALLDNHAILLLEGDRANEAEALCREGIARMEPLVDRHPRVLDYQEVLGNLFMHQGVAYLYVGRIAEAETALNESIRVQEQVVHRQPTVLRYQESLALAYNNLGALYDDWRRPREAERPYRQALRLYQQLAEACPTVVGYQSSAARVQNNLALIYQQTGRRDEAAAAFQQVLQIQTRLVQQHPKVAEYRLHLGNTRVNLGTLLRDRGDPAGALPWYAEAISSLEASRQMGAEERLARDSLCDAYASRATALTRLGRHAEALADWDRALKVPPPPDVQTWLRRQRALSLARMGKAAEARAVADELAATGAKDPKAWYEAACIHACLAFTEGSNPERKEECCIRALELLRRAEAAGYFRDPARIEDLKKEGDLNTLRAREDFQKLQKTIEKNRSSPSN